MWKCKEWWNNQFTLGIYCGPCKTTWSSASCKTPATFIDSILWIKMQPISVFLDIAKFADFWWKEAVSRMMVSAELKECDLENIFFCHEYIVRPWLYKKSRFLSQNTCKMDCPANIIVRDIVLFTGFKVRNYS